VYLGVKGFGGGDAAAFLREVDAACSYMESSRPTAVNLFWATRRIREIARTAGRASPGAPDAGGDGSARSPSADDLKILILEEAKRMIDEDNAVCRAIGEHGVGLIRDGFGLLTHCNAGGLATAMYGTALSPMFRAKELGRSIRVYVDETRPLLQGARITAWELQQAGIPAVLITDGMAAAVMSQGKVDLVIVGADRVARNGDSANKIGTLGVAVIAKEFGVPFYVAAPLSTVDRDTPDGSRIPIEERDPREVTHAFGRQTAPDGIAVYNPAFDVTPAKYIKGIITERGILGPPYEESIERAFGRAAQGAERSSKRAPR
jgi:methylthioribose-1-phosphate isomerase